MLSILPAVSLPPKEKFDRLDSLDGLRGILAFAIMLYHLRGWQLGSLDSSSLLGRLGIYAVSMFFVVLRRDRPFLQCAPLAAK